MADKNVCDVIYVQNFLVKSSPVRVFRDAGFFEWNPGVIKKYRESLLRYEQ